jgi:hypothetical protein
MYGYLGIGDDMQQETKDIGTHETANVEDVPSLSETILDPAGVQEPTVILPTEERPADEDPDEVPNVMLSGRGLALPEGPTIIGRTKIILPDADGQKAGFYTAHAGLLVGQFPQFKFKRDKGDSKNVPNVTL